MLRKILTVIRLILRNLRVRAGNALNSVKTQTDPHSRRPLADDEAADGVAGTKRADNTQITRFQILVVQ